jgi:hypothetical protein
MQDKMVNRKFIVNDWKSLTKKLESINPLQKTIIMCGILYKYEDIVDKIIFKVIDVKHNQQLLAGEKKCIKQTN